MGLFGKITQGLTKTHQNLFREIAGAFGIGELNDELLEDLEERLLMADLNIETAHEILSRTEEKAHGRRINQEQLLTWMAESASELMLEGKHPERVAKPHVMLIIGVNGAGKTTTIGKLAHQFQQQGKSVMLAAADTFRAGAISQLEQWGERVGCPVIKHREGGDAAAVAYDAYGAAKSRGSDILMIDTAGRLHNKEHLMEELRKMLRVLKKHDESLPHESILVIDGNTGQNAIQQARVFNQVAPLQGLVVTKLDGTAKGGALISVSRELQVPVLWVGVGEKLDDLVPFDKNEYANGMFLGRGTPHGKQ